MPSTIRLQGNGFIYSEDRPDEYDLPGLPFFYDPPETSPPHPPRPAILFAWGLLAVGFIAIVRLL